MWNLKNKTNEYNKKCICIIFACGVELYHFINDIKFVFNLEIIILSEVRQERQISYDITHMWNFKK